MARSSAKQQGVAAANLPPWRRAGQCTTKASKEPSKDESKPDEAQKQQASLLQQQLQPKKVEPPSYLACAKKALQVAGKENQSRTQGVPLRDMCPRHSKSQSSLSDCETASGDGTCSQHSDTSPYATPEVVAVVPVVEPISTYVSMPLAPPPPPPMEAPPAIPAPEVPAQPPDSEAGSNLDLPFGSILDASSLCDDGEHRMRQQTSDEAKKLSTEAKLFVPRNMNPGAQVNPAAPWLPLSAVRVPPSQGVVAAAPPPGLSMPLRTKAAAFVPSHLKEQATTISA